MLTIFQHNGYPKLQTPQAETHRKHVAAELVLDQRHERRVPGEDAPRHLQRDGTQLDAQPVLLDILMMSSFHFHGATHGTAFELDVT